MEINSAFPPESAVSPNGVEEAASPDAASAPTSRVDAERNVFVTSAGNEIQLSGKRVSLLMLERLARAGQPSIPMKEVTLLGKRKQLEANPEDPGYRALMAEWEANQRINALVYVFTIGVAGQPPAEFIDEQRQFFPDMSDAHMKYLWVASQLPDEDIDALSNAIIGQIAATQKGLEDAAKSFRRED